jgi:hypothetical protein
VSADCNGGGVLGSRPLNHIATMSNRHPHTQKFLKKPENQASSDEKQPSGAEQRAALVQRMVDATVPEEVIAFIEVHCHGKVYGARREKTDPSSSSPLYPVRGDG